MSRRVKSLSSDVLEVPECPRGHQGSRVVFAGFTGKAGTKRQQYRCHPVDGQAPHRFVPQMPRLLAPESHCRECENSIHSHEGPRTARDFVWPVRTIAEALLRVGSGMSYIRAAAEVRATQSNAGQLVADWVEAFTEPLWQAHGPKTWPAYLIADSKPIYVRDKSAPIESPERGAGRKKRPTAVAYHLHTVIGSDGPALGGRTSWEWKPVITVAHKKRDQQAWEEVFGLLPGHPSRLTCDDDRSLMNAAYQTWPLNKQTGEAEVFINYCLWHLAEGFRSSTSRYERLWLRAPEGSTGKRRADRMWAAHKKLSQGPDEWWEFVKAVEGLLPGQPSSFLRWLNRGMRAEYVLDQLAFGPPGQANSNAAAEAELRWIAGQWSGRQGSYRNQERTNRLLKLMTLTRRGGATPSKWMDTISESLNSSGGRPTQKLRSVCEPLGHPGLR